MSWTAYATAAVLKYSGVPTYIEIRVQPDAKHKVSHKVSTVTCPDFTPENSFVLSTDNPPRILAAPDQALDANLVHKAVQFVILNKRLLDDYYFKRRTDTAKVLASLKHIGTGLTRAQIETAAAARKATKSKGVIS